MKLIDYFNKCDLDGVLKYYETMVEDINGHVVGVENVINTFKEGTFLTPDNTEHDGNPFEVSWYIPADDKQSIELGMAEPDDDPYWNVSVLNSGFEEPPADLKPWGCTGDEPPPEGYYDCNDTKYSKYWAVTGIPWSQLMNKEVVVNCNRDFDINEVVAALVFEITFWGYTEDVCKEFLNDLIDMKDEYFKSKENTIEDSDSK